ncbi:MAG: transposase, partial [Thiogranum sp.]
MDGTDSAPSRWTAWYSACLSLNPHFHMLYLNGVYDSRGYFWPVKPPSREDLDIITHTVATRIARYLEKAGYLVRDPEHEYLDLMPDEDDAMNGIVGASITYRLAFGPNAGRKALTLKTVPATERPRKPNELVSRQAGFSLHAGVACKSNQRKKLERLCRYITRPAIDEQ